MTRLPQPNRAEPARIVNAMTVDVEDYFQVQAFAGCVARERWDGFERRVEANTDRMLDQFARAGVHATFFTLAWVAERHPALIRRIVAGGHELASHGYDHTRADAQNPLEFAADVGRARRVLEQTGGVPVIGYRAATFSIGPRNEWAFDVLAEQGYAYSSSTYPVRHDLYGDPSASRRPYRPRDGQLWEFPMSTVRVMDQNLPCSGGGYFRLLPYAVFRRGLQRLHRTERRSGIFYTHPWEIDARQPRIRGARAGARFRHYVNLSRTEQRLERLLHDFAWDRMDHVFADLLHMPAAMAA